MRVALTFDAELAGRPHADPWSADRILDCLERREVPSTWFLQGRWCRAQPETARRVADAGHLVGNHSMMHAPYTWLTNEGIALDVREAETELLGATTTGGQPWFRCPNLVTSLRVEQALSDLGYWIIGADVLSFDWEPACTPVQIVHNVTANVRDGSVVLFHSWPRTTALALPRIVGQLRDQGAEFVTVADLR